MKNSPKAQPGAKLTLATRTVISLSTVLITVSPIPALAADDGDNTWIVVLAVIVIGLYIYFLPSIFAFKREHPNRWIILAINTFLGATGIIWLASLIWALRAVHISATGNDGGESGLNVAVNDEATVRVIHENQAGSAGTDIVSQLQRLKGLLDSGAITPDEYEHLKRQAIQPS
ncbi:superinfection immunity protein [bacterium]|nr:superinfection immunity protein [bacterium]MBY0510195.1 superinfection immunity protein [Rhodospirillaceae bacterium]